MRSSHFLHVMFLGSLLIMPLILYSAWSLPFRNLVSPLPIYIDKKHLTHINCFNSLTHKQIVYFVSSLFSVLSFTLIFYLLTFVWELFTFCSVRRKCFLVGLGLVDMDGLAIGSNVFNLDIGSKPYNLDIGLNVFNLFICQ